MARVLLVDDDPDFRGAARFVLENAAKVNYEIHEAETADGALAKLRVAKQEKAPYQVILLDLRLPKMSGEEAFDQVRDLAGGAPIIIVTAHGRTDSVVALLQKGANAVLAKPITRDELLDTIRENLLPPEYCKVGWTGTVFEHGKLQGESRRSVANPAVTFVVS